MILKKFNDSDLKYLEFSFSESEKILAIKTAILKSQHTMSYSQNGYKRDPYTKICKQLQGVLAEMAVVKLLERIISKNGLHALVERYDDIREDGFKSPVGEFDIRITIGGREIFFEVRSSICHHDISYKNMQGYPIIGKYTNSVKTNEKNSDFFIRPLFITKTKGVDLLTALQNNELTVFVANACFGADMENKSKIGSLGQSNTKYQLLEQSEDTNILNFSRSFLKFIRNLSDKPIDEKDSSLKRKIKP